MNTIEKVYCICQPIIPKEESIMGGKKSVVVDTTAKERLDVFDQYDQQQQQNSQENVNNSNDSKEESNMNNNNQNNNNNQKAPMSPVVKNLIGGAACVAVGAAACYFIVNKLNDPTCNNNTNSAFKVAGGIN